MQQLKITNRWYGNTILCSTFWRIKSCPIPSTCCSGSDFPRLFVFARRYLTFETASSPGQDFSEEAAKAVSSLFDLALKVVSRVNSYHERQSLLQEEVAKLMGNLSVELLRRGCTGTIVLLADSLTNAHRSLEGDANDLFLPRLPKGSEG
jgi:hypothetical protein